MNKIKDFFKKLFTKKEEKINTYSVNFKHGAKSVEFEATEKEFKKLFTRKFHTRVFLADNIIVPVDEIAFWYIIPQKEDSKVEEKQEKSEFNTNGLDLDTNAIDSLQKMGAASVEPIEEEKTEPTDPVDPVVQEVNVEKNDLSVESTVNTKLEDVKIEKVSKEIEKKKAKRPKKTSAVSKTTNLKK